MRPLTTNLRQHRRRLGQSVPLQIKLRMISTTSRPPSGSWKASARETKAASIIPFPTKPKGMHWTHYEQRRTGGRSH